MADILTNQDGTSKVDTLVYDQGGSGVVYHTYAGSDKITIKEGSITLVNEGGNDSFEVIGGSGHNITGGANNDTLNINGADAVTADLGSGRDIINISNSNGQTSSGLTAIRGGDWTDTFTTSSTAKSYALYGDKGDDVFYINGGTSMLFWGGAANDTFVVKGGTSTKLYGGDSADSFEIYAAKQNMVLGYGNDVVNVYSGNSQAIKGNLGINEINLWAGSSHVITADIDQAASRKKGYSEEEIKAGIGLGYGVDKVLVDGATGVMANLGDGKDYVELKTGSSHKIYTEGWGDTVLISGAISRSTVDLGAGDDELLLQAGSGTTVMGGEGSDTFRVSGGTDTVINAGAGNDLLELTAGTIKTLDLGGGEDTIDLNGGSISTLKLNGSVATIAGHGGEISNVAGSAGADQLTITGPVTINRLDLSGGDDKLSLDSAAVSIATLMLGSGDDQLIINEAKDITISGGFGNDTMVILGGSRLTLNGEGSMDTITVAGGDDITVTGDEGNDTLILTGGNQVVAKAGSGDDTLVVDGVEAAQLYGGAGLDSFELKTGSGNLLMGEEGADQFLIVGGTDNVVDGGAHNDTFTVEGGSNILKGGSGVDSFIVNGSEATSIYGDDGDDSFIVNGSEAASIYGGQGNDALELRNGLLTHVELGDETETITLKAGTIRQLQAGKTVTNISGSGGRIESLLGGGATSVINLKDAVTVGALDLSTVDGTTVNLEGQVSLETLQLGEKSSVYNLKSGTIGQSGTTVEFSSVVDKVNLMGISNHSFDTGAGNDIINISAGNQLEVELGAGNDRITVAGGSNLKLTGSAGQNTYDIKEGTQIEVYGGQDSDNILVEGGKNITINGGSGSNTIIVNGGNNVTINGGTGSNTYEVKDGIKVAVNGTEKSEAIKVSGGSGITLDCGAGDDHITYAAATGGVVLAGEGDDYIEVLSGNINTLDLGGAQDQDTLNMKGGSITTATFNGGRLTVKGTGGMIDSLIGGSGDDSVDISGSVNINKLDLGEGNETITVAGGDINVLDMSKGEKTLNWSGGVIRSLKLNKTMNQINFIGVSNVSCITGFNGTVENITVSSGTGLNIDTGDKNDIITINGGTNSTIDGGYNNDTFYVNGGSGHILRGGYESDTFIIRGGTNITLQGNHGEDTYRFEELQAGASYVVDRGESYFTRNVDTLDFSNYNREDFQIAAKGEEVVFTYKENGANITVKDWGNNTNNVVKFADTGLLSKDGLFREAYLDTSSQVGILKSFMYKLNTTGCIGFNAIDDAVNYASLGKYTGLSQLVEEYKADIINAKITNSVQAEEFYKTYCGIELVNEDTGAISGADCGGSQVKDMVSVVAEPEGITVDDFTYEARNIYAIDYMDNSLTSFKAATTKGGLTFYWNDSGWYSMGVSTAILEKVVGGIITAWADAATNLIEESYGLSFDDEFSSLYTLADGTRAIQLELYKATDGILASAQKAVREDYTYVKVRVNTYFYQNSVNDVNGNASSSGGIYLDRVLAHELTHSVLGVNVLEPYDVPTFINEGLAELVHGGDYRHSLYNIVNANTRTTTETGVKTTTQEETLDAIFNLTDVEYKAPSDYAYTGGYSILRYFAKQVYDEYNPASSSLQAANLDFESAAATGYNLTEELTKEQATWQLFAQS